MAQGLSKRTGGASLPTPSTAGQVLTATAGGTYVWANATAPLYQSLSGGATTTAAFNVNPGTYSILSLVMPVGTATGSQLGVSVTAASVLSGVVLLGTTSTSTTPTVLKGANYGTLVSTSAATWMRAEGVLVITAATTITFTSQFVSTTTAIGSYATVTQLA